MRHTLPASGAKSNRAAIGRRSLLAALSAALIATLLAVSPASAQRGQVEPESSTGLIEKPLATATRFMISTANSYASEAGRDVLRAGGSAVDAAIAAQLVLGLVEPQSSGLGGGAFIVSWDQAAKSLTTYDGRETAPASAKPDRFITNGAPMVFENAVKSGLSIGTPGIVRLIEEAHKKHGRLPWARLFEPAIKLAADGFEVSRRLSLLLTDTGPDAFDPAARGYFFDDAGKARGEGAVLKNPEYAATLRAIAANGADAFYTGELAEKIVEAVANAHHAAGDLSLADLAAYRVEERKPLCVTYRSRNVCGMGPPSSGGLAIAQILKLLEPFQIGHGAQERFAPEDVHLVAEAQKLAYADRDRYLADPAFVPVPDAGLLDTGYLDGRRKLIDPARAMPKPLAGDPPKLARRAFGRDATIERAGTSHISVIDGAGNAISMTTTIEGAFGSGVWAAGFLLNNELTDFSFKPADDTGVAIANRVEPGKRPRSTMSPTIVFDAAGNVEAVLGSPGGGRIIYYVAKTLIGMIDLGLDPQAAAALPNFGSQGGPLDLELTWGSIPTVLRMGLFGQTVRMDSLNSGIHVVARRNGRLEGAADPRREGAALGD